MTTILFLAHTEADGTLARAGREAFAAARELSPALPGARLLAGLSGAVVQPAADLLAGAGVERVLAVQGPEFAISRSATDALAAAALCGRSEATFVVAPATPRLARCLPIVAQRLGGAIDTQIVALQAGGGTLHVQRWYYRQRLFATLTRAQRPWLLTVAPGVFAPFAGAAGRAAVEDVPVALAAAHLRTQVTGVVASGPGADTIRPDADVLLVAGAGWGKKQADGQVHGKQAENLILAFLAGSRASLGGTKSIVDQQGDGAAVLPFLTHLHQVGQTGSSPRHRKGLSTCCYGEEPHVVGWRFVRERRAINLDAGCGWARGKADVLYVADAFAVMAKVNELLAATAPASG